MAKPEKTLKTKQKRARALLSGKKKASTATAKHADKIVEYYSDIDNPGITRGVLATDVVGISRKNLYEHFSPEELATLEAEGLRIRRSRYASVAVDVDNAVVRTALTGDVAAQKLFYQRFEGWNPATKVQVDTSLEQLRKIAIEKGFDPEEYISTFMALKDKGDLNE